MNNDETMSLEQAFSTEDLKQEDVFKFEEEETKKDNSTHDTSSSPVGNEDTEQKVPYSRFKKKVDEVAEYGSKIQYLEEQLAEMQSSRQSTKTSNEPLEIPAEWTELYGNSDTAKRAYEVQMKLQEKLEEAAVERAIRTMQSREVEAQNALVENEEIINDNLASLQETVGRKLSPKQEEDILTIVDEFSPTDSQGKYISLFPFDKAYEIYSLRQGAKGRSTFNARSEVANLTGNASTGDTGDSNSSFQRGWDSWRQAL